MTSVAEAGKEHGESTETEAAVWAWELHVATETGHGGGLWGRVGECPRTAAVWRAAYPFIV